MTHIAIGVNSSKHSKNRALSYFLYFFNEQYGSEFCSFADIFLKKYSRAGNHHRL